MARRTKWKTDTIGGRLGSAIDRLPREGKSRGVGLLISKLEKRKAPGASYPSIKSYLDNKVEPPLAFLRAAAEVLDVRCEWLVFGGDEGRTEEEHQARLHHTADDDGEGAGIYAIVRDAVPQLAELDPSVSPAFVMLLIRWLAAEMRSGISDETAFEPEHVRNTALDLWGAVVSPVDVWSRRLHRQVQMDPSDFSDYAMAMIHTLVLSVRIAIPEGISLEEIETWAPTEDEEDANVEA